MLLPLLLITIKTWHWNDLLQPLLRSAFPSFLCISSSKSSVWQWTNFSDCEFNCLVVCVVVLKWRHLWDLLVCYCVSCTHQCCFSFVLTTGSVTMATQAYFRGDYMLFLRIHFTYSHYHTLRSHREPAWSRTTQQMISCSSPDAVYPHLLLSVLWKQHVLNCLFIIRH